MDSDSDYDELPGDSSALDLVVPSILAELNHLDLSGRVIFRENKVVVGGAYGNICKARCTFPTRGKIRVAAKRLRFYLKEDVKTLFEKEIYVWAKLRHDNILPLLGYAFDNQTGYPILVSEWMQNGSAWSFVLSHPGCDLMRLVTGIAQGLAYLHENGIVHSDIKSDNILVTDSEDALICDFGCSRVLAASRTLANLSTGIKGTPQYLAYELVAFPGEYSKHSKETDVWALGMTIFELLAHERPYADISAGQVIVAIMSRKLPTLPAGAPSLISSEATQMLLDICQLCWDHIPYKRVDMPMVLRKLSVPLTEIHPGDASVSNANTSLNMEGSLTERIQNNTEQIAQAHDIPTTALFSNGPNRERLAANSSEEKDYYANYYMIDSCDDGGCKAVSTRHRRIEIPVEDDTERSSKVHQNSKIVALPLEKDIRSMYTNGFSENEQKPRSRSVWRWPSEARPVFGVPLEESLAVSQIAKIPAVVFRCIQYLEVNGADQEIGIYLSSGHLPAIKYLKSKFNAEGAVELLALGIPDPHIVTGLLRTFLRELPSSVFTHNSHMCFLSILDRTDVQECMRDLQKLISQIPPANYWLLRALMAHFTVILQNSTANLMTMHDLDVVLGPILGFTAGNFGLMMGYFNHAFIINSDRALEDDVGELAQQQFSKGPINKSRSSSLDPGAWSCLSDHFFSK